MTMINADTGERAYKKPKAMERTAKNGVRSLSFEDACKRFKSRFTVEHVPTHAKKLCERTGKYAGPHYHSDAEWYKKTEFLGFHTTAARKYCRSTGGETYPAGRWLDAPYKLGDFTMREAKEARRAERYPAKKKSRRQIQTEADDMQAAAKLPPVRKQIGSAKKLNHKPTKKGK